MLKTHFLRVGVTPRGLTHPVTGRTGVGRGLRRVHKGVPEDDFPVSPCGPTLPKSRSFSDTTLRDTDTCTRSLRGNDEGATLGTLNAWASDVAGPY